MRIAIITDIHEDITKLKRAFVKIEKLKCDEIICLGDISGYSVPHYSYQKTRNAHECLSLIRSNCKIVVLGNHDIHAGQVIPKKCTFFNYPENWYKLDYYSRHKLSDNILWLHEEDDLSPLYRNEDIEYLKTLPEFSVYEVSGINILFSHYIYPNISGLKKEFYTYKDELKQHFIFMNSMNSIISFTGHSHIPGLMVATNNKYGQYRYKKINLNHEPSCIGIPPIARSEKRSGFCIFDTKDYSIEVIKI